MDNINWTTPVRKTSKTNRYCLDIVGARWQYILAAYLTVLIALASKL
jgi:hypothetical protein